jgi:hypothetical protein
MSDAVLLRIFVGEDDQYRGKPLIPAIISKALESRMAGATVLNARDGFGVSRTMRVDFNSIDAGPRLPQVVEIVDDETKINSFLTILNDMIGSGLITLERVRARQYRALKN